MKCLCYETQAQAIVTFQHTLPRRERLAAGRLMQCVSCWFQHTLPRRERHKRLDGMDFWHNRFNTRSREGSDSSTYSNRPSPTSFQHTLPRRERRCKLFGNRSSITVSTHAPAKGATRQNKSKGNCKMFQHTLPRRERRVTRKLIPTSSRVSTHAPAKGATYALHQVA